MARVFEKDPDAVLDYKFDWSDWLASGETIDTYVIAEDTGITLDSDGKTDSDTSVTIWLSGGTVDTNYNITCSIDTTDSREDDRTMIIKVRQR